MHYAPNETMRWNEKRKLAIPGLKPPVRDFVPSDDGDPSEVDAFINMIREFRRQGPPTHADAR